MSLTLASYTTNLKSSQPLSQTMAVCNQDTSHWPFMKTPACGQRSKQEESTLCWITINITEQKSQGREFPILFRLPPPPPALLFPDSCNIWQPRGSHLETVAASLASRTMSVLSSPWMTSKAWLSRYRVHIHCTQICLSLQMVRLLS